MHENKQEFTKVVSLLKNDRNLYVYQVPLNQQKIQRNQVMKWQRHKKKKPKKIIPMLSDARKKILTQNAAAATNEIMFNWLQADSSSSRDPLKMFYLPWSC